MPFSTRVRGLGARLALGFFVAFFEVLAPGLEAPRPPGGERGGAARAEPAQARRTRSKAAKSTGEKSGEAAAPGEGAAASGAKAIDPKAPPPTDAKPGGAKPGGAIPAPPASAAAPAQNVWTDREIIAALQECVKALGPAAAEIEPAPPLRAGVCGAAAPVLLRRAGAAPGVEIRPPAMVNCAMAARLAEWVDKIVQPAARETLGGPIVALASFSGYECRFRNGAPAGKLSEHAYANALDIAGFVTANKRKVDVLTAWGPTRRDLEAQASAKAKEDAKEEPPSPDARSKEETAEEKPAPARGKRGREEKEKDKTKDARSGAKARGRATEAAPEAPPPEPVPAKPAPGKGKRGAEGRDAKAPAASDMPLPEPKSAAASAKPAPERQFLSRVHDGACGIFMTVLGPEANEAHRNHFHLDLAPRKRTAFCE